MVEYTHEVSGWKEGYFLLLFTCLMGFSGFFNIDIPSALQVDIEENQVPNCSKGLQSECCTECLGLGPDRYNQLYAIFSWTVSASSLPAGLAADFLGHRVSSVLFSSTTLLGSVLFFLGTTKWFRHTEAMFPIMMTGRLLLGIGTISIKIVQNCVVKFWFEDRKEFAIGTIIATFRMGTVLNFFITSRIAYQFGMTTATFVGAAIGCLGFVSSLALVILDVYGRKRIGRHVSYASTSRQVNCFRLKEFPLRYWLITVILASFYADFVSFVANLSKWINDKYGIHKTIASYITGVPSDVSIILSPVAGVILTRVDGSAVAALAGSMMVFLSNILMIVSHVTPVVIALLFGVGYVFVAVSMWSEITNDVPLDMLATALGLTNAVGGFLSGVTSLVIGKLMDFLEQEKYGNETERWNAVMTVLLYLGVVCLTASTMLVAKDYTKKCELQMEE